MRTQPPPPHSRAQTLLVRAAVIATAIVFLLTVALIFHRWVTIDVPDGTLIVQGNRDLAGAEVVLEGVPLDEPMRQTIGPARNYSVQFFLHPGRYRMTVFRDERELMIRDFELPPGAPGYRFNLTDLDPRALDDDE